MYIYIYLYIYNIVYLQYIKPYLYLGISIYITRRCVQQARAIARERRATPPFENAPSSCMMREIAR